MWDRSLWALSRRLNDSSHEFRSHLLCFGVPWVFLHIQWMNSFDELKWFEDLGWCEVVGNAGWYAHIWSKLNLNLVWRRTPSEEAFKYLLSAITLYRKFKRSVTLLDNKLSSPSDFVTMLKSVQNRVRLLDNYSCSYYPTNQSAILATSYLTYPYTLRLPPNLSTSYRYY